MATLDMHNLQSTYKVRMYLLCNFFELLLVETTSNHACFLSIKIHILKIHILCQQYLIVELDEMTFDNNSILFQYMCKSKCEIHQLLQLYESHKVPQILVLKS